MVSSKAISIVLTLLLFWVFSNVVQLGLLSLGIFASYYTNKIPFFIIVFFDGLNYNINVFFLYTYINDEGNMIRGPLHFRKQNVFAKT